ncbi:MAG: glycosyltransferase family 2 protein [Armatimonadota bacterium]
MAGTYDVIIPTYNRRETLARVLRGLEQQDTPELLGTVVVVDDGSTDGTAEAVRSLATPLRICLLEGRKGGPAAARNAGIAAAEAERILFLCDDIEPAPQLLAAHAARSRDVNDAHAVVGRVDWPPGTRVRHFARFVMERYHFGFGALADLEELPFHAFITANLSIARELVLSLGGFDEGFTYGWEDTDLGLRATLQGVRLLYAPQALGYHHHEITPASYCRRQEAVGRSAVHFVRKHPAYASVVGAARLPRPWTPRWAVKGALFNRLTLGGWALAARSLSALGGGKAAELIYSQVLASCYYRGMARALATQARPTQEPSRDR